MKVSASSVAIVALQQLQGLDRGLQRLPVLRLPGEVARLQAERAVEQVVDLGLDAGHLLDQLAVLLGLGGEQPVGLDRGAQEGDDDLGVLLRVVAASTSVPWNVGALACAPS